MENMSWHETQIKFPFEFSAVTLHLNFHVISR